MSALILLRDWEESQIEFWRKIVGFDGYDVSSKGRVRSWWKRKALGYPRGYKYILGERYSVLRTSPMKARERNNQDYDRHYIYRSGKRFCFFTHRLVAQAFLPNPDNWPQVNHKTGLGADNRVDNLEWSSRSHDRRHALDNGLVEMPTGMNWFSFNRKLVFTPDTVRDVRARVAAGELQTDLAREFGVHPNTIGKIVHRIRWAYVD